ncbi:MAG TPA: hypothetical protein VFC16_07275 [Nakamurella sp.]|nr:hypothetical protein [Nakamurella sp.]
MTTAADRPPLPLRPRAVVAVRQARRAAQQLVASVAALSLRENRR